MSVVLSVIAEADLWRNVYLEARRRMVDIVFPPVTADAGPAPAHGLVPPQRVQQLVQLLRRGRPDALELLHEAAEVRREAAPRREPLRVAARPQRGLAALRRRSLLHSRPK